MSKNKSNAQQPADASDSSKGNSKNTGGGTEQSFMNTPQAKDDLFGTGSGRIDYQDSIYYLDVMGNDLAGNAKWLWSVDDGVNDSGAMSGYEAGDLLTQDQADISGLAENTSQFGAAIWITSDGKIAYDAGSITGKAADDLTELALGDTLTDTFIYAIRMSNGTLSWAQASVTVTGVNDTPTVESVSISAIEDGAAVSGAFQGDDVDSDNDINDLSYDIIGAPGAGTLTNNGDGTFTFNPGADFQTLSQGEATTITLSYTATDRHGAVSDPATLTISMTGVNDAPTLAAGTGSALEDGSDVSIDLAPLGDDIDSEDTGSSLTYSVTGQPAEGSASTSGTNLIFSPGSDFQNLAEGETRDVVVQITATDAQGASAVNDVTITVTGKNDLPVVQAVSVAAVEDGSAVTGSFNGNDIDSDDTPNSLVYTIIGSPAAGSLVNNGDGTFTFNPGIDFQGLAKNEVTTITLTYTATDGKGAVSAPASLTIDVTGVNDNPTLAAGSGAATEDGSAIDVDLSALGDDVDSDNDGNNLIYSISGAPAEGSASINGSSLTFAPGADFQDLNEGETRQVVIGVTATDAHGATATNDVTITVTGTNDAPTLTSGTLAAQEDGSAVSLDLTALGDDVDNEDTGSSLAYSLLNAAPGGSASIDANGVLSFDPSADFQGLAKNESTSFDLEIQATDARGASTSNTVTVTVTGTNDAPTLASAGMAATEDGAAVNLDLTALGNDVDSDDDGSTLDYVVLNTPAGGSADVNGTVLSFNPDGDFQSLAQGETTTVDLQVQATDAHGASATNTVTVTVTGVNDAPAITGGNSSGTVTMNPIQAPFKVEQWTGYNSDHLSKLQGYAASNAPDYTVTTSVIDYTDDPAGFAGEIPGSSPWPAAQATGATTNTGINDNFFARVTTQILITEADTYTFRTFNDDGVFLSVNNKQIISNSGYFPETAFEGSIALTPGVYPLELYFYEGGGEASLELSYKNSSGIYQHVGNSTLTTTGTLTFDDVDLSDVHSVTTDVASLGSLGTLTASIASDTTGSGTGGTISWSYELSGDQQQQLKSLAEGETSVQEFLVKVSDGKGGSDSQTVSITVEGANDVAELGNAVVDLTETDAQLTASGTLSITDVDNGEAFFTAQTDTAGTYGKFSIDANGNWSFASNGALDDLEEGELVTDIFNVSSVDGTTTTVTVNITGTADGPTAVADSASLTASAVTARADNTVYWVDWQSITAIPGNAFGEVNVSGTITLPDRTIDVTYTGQIYSPQTFISPTNTTNYWSSYQGGASSLPGGQGVYTSTQVPNGPGDSNFDFIALAYADTPRTVTFSEPVENLFFAVASMNNNGYLFDQPFTVVSSADSANDRGYWGHTEGITLTDSNGQYGISTAGFSPNEFHGVLAINNAVGSLTWVSQSEEFWQGFTLGTYGVAQSATVSGNVLDNDDVGNGPPVEVTDVDGSVMVGNSVTLNLASGAILTVGRDGDYFYDDQGQFEALADGETFTETVQYTITDDRGYTDTATLSITVTGINDGPVAVADSATVNEDSSVTINVLANDTDPDNGDTLSIASATNGQNGTVTINNNQLIYTPNADFHGTDSVSYVVTDAAGETSTASVDITVTPVADTFVISNLIQNGSFENGLTGWSSSQINYIGDWQAADGSKTLDLNAESGGGYVEQTMQTVPNQTYTVGFALSKNPGSPTGTETLRVSAAGQSQDYVFNDASSSKGMSWNHHTFNFTANSSTTTIRLASADPAGGTDAWGPALDEVVAFSDRLITGFDKLLGDKIDLSGLLDSINAPNDNTAFSGGYLNFQDNGSGDTLVRIDADGGANDYITVVTLVGVSLTETDTGNFIL